MNTYDVAVIGGGIVGLSTAYKLLLTKPGINLLLLEKESEVAKHQTGNNSGVIHSGIYYKPGSLKAKNCIDGYNQLLKFCDSNDIKYELCGKLILAVDESELPSIKNIYDRGIQNGSTGLRLLDKHEISEIEPKCIGIKAILVPQTGIIDYKEVSFSLVDQIRKLGGEIFFNNQVMDIKNSSDDLNILTNQNNYSTKLVVNCAGLYSDKVAKMTMENVPVKIIPFRGEYYKIKEEAKNIVRNLIYPVPDPAFPFLGVHFTRGIDGEVEAGPNAVFSFKREGYTKYSFSLIDSLESLLYPGFLKVAAKYWKTGVGEFYRSFSKKAFTKALQRLVPDINELDLIEGGAGVRAQACDINGKLVDDFLIFDGKNYINVCNAPSPAATSCLAIGDYISSLITSKIS